MEVCEIVLILIVGVSTMSMYLLTLLNYFLKLINNTFAVNKLYFLFMSHLLTSLMNRQLLPLIGYMFVVFNSFLCF